MARLRPGATHPDPSETGPAPAGLNWRDILSGLGVIGLSLAFLWLSRDYGFGSLRRMGAGFFPVVLGWAGVGLGALLCLRAFLDPAPERAPGIRARRLLFISAAFVTFGVSITTLGLPLTVFATSLVGSLADDETSLREALMVATCLALGIWGLFVGLLGLPLPVTPGFI